MDTEVQEASPAPPKFSRYRLVRIAAAKEAPAAPLPDMPIGLPMNETVHRSLSRYRNARPESKPVEPLPQLGSRVRQEPPSSLPNGGVREQTPKEVAAAPYKQSGEGNDSLTGSLENPLRSAITANGSDPLLVSTVAQGSSGRAGETLTEQSVKTTPIKPGKRASYNDAQREAFALLNGEGGRQQKLPQTRKDREETHKRQAVTPTEEVQYDARIGEADKSRYVGGELMCHNVRRAQVTSPLNENLVSTPRGAGRHSNVPGIDAPISAINTGERFVNVKHNHSSIMLPVNTSTTVESLFRAAAITLPESFDTKSTVILESFKRLGIERPLRKYERVRDVLNSWDRDDQNSLLVVPSFSGISENDLESAGLSNKQPDEVSVELYHSQKPGVWDKTQITLRSDGQILLTNGTGEKKNICHMSDFDVYVPTHRQMKKLSPPKKLCFAIKSQQKSAMFLSTANFVHFFATKDKATAELWYRAVQKWRSWYLVHILGNGQTKDGAIPISGHDVGRRLKAEKKDLAIASGNQTDPLKSVANQADIKNNHIQKQPTLSPVPQTIEMSSRIQTVRKHTLPPVSFPRKFVFTDKTGRAALNGPVSAPLRSQFSKTVENATTIPFESTLGQQRAIPQSQLATTNVSREAPGLTRSTSQRYRPGPLFKPLVDLTPQFQEPPQHSTKGRGITINTLPKGGLVNIATSPETAVPLPPTTTLRRHGSGHQDDYKTQRAATMRAAGHHPYSALPSPDDSEAAFIAGGLVAQATLRQEARRQGKGIVAGHRGALEPMLDVTETSIYAPGSLLASVERQAGVTGPAIDREKKREVVTSTGETR